MSVAERIRELNEKIALAARASGREPNQIQLIAVSKKMSMQKIREAYAAGIRTFGENYVQEALGKINELNDLDIRWHMVGHLQSNKVKSIAGRFALIHSIDSEKLINEIDKRSERAQEILIEVNLAAESSKSGVAPESLPSLLHSLQQKSNVHLRGLMFMPPFELTASESAKYFEKARQLREKMAKEVSGPHNLHELSMGTSHDFEVAIQNGATMIRLGTVIFGPRD